MKKINNMFNAPQYLQVKGNRNSLKVWSTAILYSYVDRLDKKPITGAEHRYICREEESETPQRCSAP